MSIVTEHALWRALVVGGAAALDGQPFAVEVAGDLEAALLLVQQATAAGRPFAVALLQRDMAEPGAREALDRIAAADSRMFIVAGSSLTELLAGPENVLVLPWPADAAVLRPLVRALAQRWDKARAAEARISELETAVKAKVEALRKAEEALQQGFEANPLPQSIIALDRFEVIAVNSAYRKTFGFSLETLRNVTPENFGRGLDTGRWRGLMGKLFKHEPIDEHPFVYEIQPGVFRHMVCSARAIMVVGRLCSIWVMRDVTAQLKLEEQARQAQKMEAIGQLAAGVAHDFNNLLTAIQGFTSQALLETQDPRMRKLLEPAQSSTQQAASLTRQLLLFSRKQAVQVKELDLAKVVRDLQSVLRRLLPEHIELVWDIPDGASPRVMADIGNVEQIVVNLTMNARDALPPKGGAVRIGVHACEFATAEATGHVEGRAGKFVRIQVSDNGSGIAPEVLPRIFEPFFTTKETVAGKGTGLGLSTAYSVIRQHHGWVTVQTEVGRGTTFSVYLPVYEAPASAKLTAPKPPPAKRRIGRVLAVEDDPNVQAVIRMIFEIHQIDGLIAPDGNAALKMWEDAGGEFDLLMTDVVMPNGYTGIELARTLRGRKPTLHVVIMTGYSSDLLNPDSLAMPGGPPRVLMKPFKMYAAYEAMTAG